MLSPLNYLVLYKNVNAYEIKKYLVKSKEIKVVVESMVEVYKPDQSLRTEKIVLNYDDPAYRCAYLFKYAPFHTCLIQDMFTRALYEAEAIINPNFWSNNNCMNICSLGGGGGPGIDVIGVLSALRRKYGPLRCSAQIIQSMSGWKDTFYSILEEFQINTYELSENLSPEFLQFSFIVADLLGVDSIVNKAIGSANLITMVKFLSAATCMDSAQMIRKIFHSMRHGAVVFIIDDASGGYSHLVSHIAKECQMVPVFGPLQCVNYAIDKFNVKKYGSRSCFSSLVTVHLLMKPFESPIREWTSHFNPIPMNSMINTDNDHSSGAASALSFNASNFDFNYSRKYSISYEQRVSLPAQMNPFHKGQDILNVEHLMGYDFRHRKLSQVVASGSNLFPSNNFTFKDDMNTNSQNNFKQYDKPFYTVSNSKLFESQLSGCTDRSNSPISEREGFDARFYYPSYDLLPQNEVSVTEGNNKGFENLLPSSVDGSERKINQEHVTPTLNIDCEEKDLTQKTVKLTEDEGNAEIAAIALNLENILREDTIVETECEYCSRFKRINWLQKKCEFCNA